MTAVSSNFTCNHNTVSKVAEITLFFWLIKIISTTVDADWIGKPTSHDGLDLGDEKTALIALLIIMALVGYLTVTHNKEMLTEERAVDR